MIKKEKYDIIIINLTLSDIESIDLIAKIRSSKIQVPILFILNKYDKTKIIRALDSGGDIFLVKPYDYQELVAKVKAICKKYNNF